ncbi:tetratricopeptide repeat protein [Streptomyces sp. NPDC047002]|uniref:tetratricopeptide repeat protein n=1 Tax=Streptomyces sp. NPDC047002 TaxID=3155475 RepID=UPI003451274F
MDAMNQDRARQSRQIKRAALAVGVGGLLVAGALVCVPDGRQGAPPPPGPEARALDALSAGAPASGADLAALIRGREARVRAHPGDARAWAVLGSAYVQRGVRQADPAAFPRAERALGRALAGPLPDASATPVAPSSPRASTGTGASLAPESPAAPPTPAAPTGATAVAAGAPARAATGAPAADTPPEALVGLAALADARRDYPAARAWGERALRRSPTAWAAYPPLIDAYNGLGDYEAAGRAARRLAAARPKAPAAAAENAVVHRDRGRREDAAAQASAAVEQAAAPAQKAAALAALGDLAWERGEPAEALGQYGAALQAAPDLYAAQAGRGRALASLGRTDEAYQAYDTALARLPDPAYALEYGELYESLGLTGDASTQYAKVRALAARGTRAGVDENLVLGRYEADHGAPAAAVTRLTAEWTGGRRGIETADALGWALYRSGDASRALTYATTATEQGRRSALSTYHRGEIERALGMRAEARRHLDEALRTNPYFSPLLAPRAREALGALGGSAATGGAAGAPGDLAAEADSGTAQAPAARP